MIEKKILRNLLSTLILPHKCFLCGRVVIGTAWICGKCILPITDSLCPHCGKSWDDCICGRISYDGASVPLWYTEGARQGLHRFKYSGRTYYAPFLAKLMVQRLYEDLGKIPFDLISYVPMHPKKRKARGYCQSELLANEVAALLDLPIENTLYHTENRCAQMEQKGYSARKINALKSFIPGDQNLSGLRILLIDDILTTGTTLSRCAELLKKQGATMVYCLVVATGHKFNNPNKW